MKKVLILGGSGLIGKALTDELMKCHNSEIYTTYFQNPVKLGKSRSTKLNIEDETNIDNILDYVKPEVIISCLRGDFNKQLLLHIKAAEYLSKNSGKLYFFSTANVFDNDLGKPHYEDEVPNSHTDYGKYKIDCEKRITEILQDNACILRIPQVWGKTSPRMLQLREAFASGKKIEVYPNLFINTNTDIIIAKNVSYIMKNNLKGTFHLTSEDTINYKDFYYKLMKKLAPDTANFEEYFHEDLTSKGYFSILSKNCSEFPYKLKVTNERVIDYLTNG